MIGTTVSHYEIVEKVGGGGMGEVYRAHDTHLDRPVALKFLHADFTSDPVAKRRFVREAKAASALQHNNICTIHDIDETESGELFISMDCYDGETLESRMAGGALPVAEALDIAAQIADGLSAAHDAGMVHRDVKPANLIVTTDGVVKIVDFGLAKLRGHSRVTKTGVTVGTISYMSPEQGRGDDVDQRSDIWSLGVVLYELLTGVVPFHSDRTAAVMYQIATKDPAPLTDHRKDLPHGLQRVIDLALHKDVSRRYRSAQEMRTDLVRIAEGLRPRRLRRRTVVRVAIAAVAAAAAAAVWSNGPRLFDGGVQHPHIAILPFENVGGDPANQAFCDGLMETLTSQLSQLEHMHKSLWVVPASEVRRSGVQSADEARRAFSVNLVFTGSVQRMSDHYRVNLNLIAVDASNVPRQIRSKTLDKNVETIAALQDEAAARVMQMLKIELRPETEQQLRAGGTEESVAYRLYVQGRGYLQRYESEENLARALASFESAIEHDSLYALAHAGLGEAYWRRYGNTRDPRWIEPAIESCERALAIDDQLAAVYVTLGMIHAGTNEPEKAVLEFDRALEIDPTNAAAYAGLATAYVRQGRKERAESTYLRAIRMKRSYWDWYNQLGWFYYREARYEEAAEQFARVVELTPDNAFGYNNLGACFWMQGAIEQARAMFEQSIEVEKNYRAFANLSAIHYIEGRYTEAAAACEEALSINNGNYKTWANLGNAYHWIPGKRDEAERAFRRATDIAEGERERTPNNPHLLASLAGYYAVLGESDRASNLVERAATMAPDNPRICYYVGHTYEQLGQRDKAIAYIKGAIEKGYTVSEVESDPWLEELVADEQFQELVRSNIEETEGPGE